MKIPKRLAQLYQLAEGPELWDIGCDHALLARINQKEKKFSTVYCVDKSKNSLGKILNIRQTVNMSSIVLIHSDGCLLDWATVKGTVVIAGVGGNTILKVIGSCPPDIRSRLVWLLNPFTSEEKFLQNALFLFDAKPIQKQDSIEKGRVRSIYKWKRSQQ